MYLLNIREVFQYRLRELRGERTQAQMAEAIGMPFPSYRNMETNGVIPQESTLSKMAAALHVPEGAFFADPDYMGIKDPIEALDVLRSALSALPQDILKEAQRVPEERRLELHAMLRASIRAFLEFPDPKKPKAK